LLPSLFCLISRLSSNGGEVQEGPALLIVKLTIKNLVLISIGFLIETATAETDKLWPALSAVVLVIRAQGAGRMVVPGEEEQEEEGQNVGDHEEEIRQIT